MLKLTCARGRQAANAQLDIVELRRRTSTLIAHLGQFDGLLRSAGTAARAAEQVRDQASRLRQLLSADLDAINTALTAA